MKRLKLFMVCLLALISMSAFAQTLTVKGKVTSTDSEPVVGAYVLVKGTTNGQLTDGEGQFVLENVPANGTLIVAFMGMKTQEIKAAANVSVVLEADAEYLNEVVVTAMGISREKKALGYAVTEVGGDEMIKARGGLNNPVNALQGKIAGLQITSSTGSMGGSSKVLLRGVSSLSGNNQPLFVIDGVPIEGKDFNTTEAARGGGGFDYGNLINDISPDDIASISVLKGASASALYGSRANNGVVMITTKKGNAGTNNNGYGVSFSSTLGFERVNKLPKLQRLYGGGYADEFDTVEINGKEYLYPDYATDESWGPKYDGQQVLSWYDLAKWEAGGKKGNPTTSEWKAPDNDVDSFFETGISIVNNIAISQSSARSATRISYTNSELKGYLPNSKQEKNILNVSAQAFSQDRKLEISANVNYLNQSTLGRSEIGYGDNNVLVKFVQWGHRELDMKQAKDMYMFPDGTQASWNRSDWDDPTPAYSNNPYWSRYMCYQNDTRNRIYGNLGASYQILPSLKFQYKANLDFFVDKQYERNAVGSQEQSKYTEIARQQYELNHEFLLTYNQLFNDFSVNALAGANLMRNHYEYVGGDSVNGLSIGGFYNLKNSISPAEGYNYERNKAINSVFANLGLGWKNMLFLDGTIRMDQSSTLPKSNNTYFYPSVTGSFIFSELLSPELKSIIEFGKLRAGYAQVGNDTDPYQILSTYSHYTRVEASTPGYRLPSTLVNDALKPESTSSFEVGLEMAFFKGRLGFDVSYYNSITKDQILPLSLSGTTGYTSKVVNSGKIQNKGVEIAIHGTPVENKFFSWNTSLTLASNKNKVLELMEGVNYYKLTSAPFLVEIGAMKDQPYGVIMGTDYVYDDNGNKMIDPDSGLYLATDGNVNLGSVYPDFTGGWTNSFRFGNFDASIHIDFSKGGKYFSTSYLWGIYSGMLEETAANNIREEGIILDGVIDDKGTKNTTVAAGIDYCEDFYTGPAAQSVLKSDYIKLREVTAGYTFPVKDGSFIKSFKISAYGRNLAVWGPDVKHFDPEVAVTSSGNIQGIEGGLVAGVANFGIGININF